jgi:hypothetical protein
MRRHLPLALLLAAAGCSESATTVEFAKVCTKELDGKTVRTTGYLRAPFAALCRTATKQNAATTVCSFDLRDRPDGEVRLSINIEVGSGESRVDEARLKDRLGAASVRDSDGRFLADKAQVRVTGALHALPNSLRSDETICWLDVDRIERR